MNIGKALNSLLSIADVAVIRRSTRDQLLHTLHQQASTAAAAQGAVQTDMLDAKLQQLRAEIVKTQIANRWSIVDAMRRGRATAPYRTCPLCHNVSEDSRFIARQSHCIFGGGTLVRHTCPSCDLIYGDDKIFELTDAELGQEYAVHYSVYSEGDSTEQEVKAFHALAPRRDGLYLNYGAGGWSKSVEQLNADGWNVMAYEPHAAVAGMSDRVIKNASELAARRFDGIFSNNVLEHFRDPVAELAAMARLLKPEGVMAHATPCFEYLYEFTRFHLFFFTGRARAVMLQHAGLSEVAYIQEGEFMCSIMRPAVGTAASALAAEPTR